MEGSFEDSHERDTYHERGRIYIDHIVLRLANSCHWFSISNTYGESSMKVNDVPNSATKNFDQGITPRATFGIYINILKSLPLASLFPGSAREQNGKVAQNDVNVKKKFRQRHLYLYTHTTLHRFSQHYGYKRQIIADKRHSTWGSKHFHTLCSNPCLHQ